ncbi:MAG: membrane-bound lytic murein transglycosylase MltF [Desulfobacterales bacterium]
MCNSYCFSGADKSHPCFRLCVLAIMGLLLSAIWLFSGCSPLSGNENDRVLERILEKGKMVVLTRNAPTTYYFGPDGATGYEYDLITAYAAHLGVDVKFETRGTIENVLEALANGEGDIAAAGLTLTEKREKYFLFGPPYFQVQQQLVCRRGGRIPGSIEEIGQVSIEVTAKSSYVERLQELEREVPDLTWQPTVFTTEQNLERVWQGKVDCTVADSNIVSLNRRYMPELVVAFPLSETEDLAWALPPGAHKLEQSIKKWFSQLDDSLSTILYGRYYAHVEIFDYVDIARFIRRIHNRLPSYRKIFKEAGKKYDIDWKFLAAMAYQESHWDPHAQSPTGVRGIMMLTQQTANQLGVENRLDPRQSIMGGARYFSNLYGRIPDGVPEPDRTWITLAAYNVGMGHIFDARNLARKLGKDPDSWVKFREVLPLLAQPQYYQNLRYGYARGSEPVRYVARIRNYYDILNNDLN